MVTTDGNNISICWAILKKLIFEKMPLCILCYFLIMFVSILQLANAYLLLKIRVI